MSEPEAWVSVEEISRHLGVSKDTIYRWIKGDMPAHRVGKLWKFKLTEADDWVRGGGAAEPTRGKKMRGCS